MSARRRTDLAVAAALVVATVAVYARVAGHEFVNYDDPQYVTANPAVQKGLGWAGVRWALVAIEAQNWHPVTWLSYMLDVSLFGVRPGPMLLVNVALHASNAVMLYALLAWTTRRTWPSALVAALFALHPAHVESVAWVSERKDVLSTAFGLGAMLAWAWWTRRPSAGRYALVGVLLALGLMAKPMLVTLPAVLLLLDVWPLGRVPPWRWRLVVEKLPLLAIVAVSVIATIAAQWLGGAVASMSSLPLGERLANAVVAYARYLDTLVRPVDLALIYPLEIPVPRAQAVAAVVALAGVTLAAVGLVRRAPYVLVGWLWFLGTLVPVIGIVQVGEQAMADRYTYLPFIGLFVALAFGAADLVATRPALRPVAALGGVLVLAACTLLSWRQVGRWRDSETILRHTLAVTTGNYLAHHGLGLALSARGHQAEAAGEHLEAVRIWPDYLEAHLQAAAILDALGRPAESVQPWQQAARLRPDDAGVRYGYAGALIATGRTGEAAAELRRALALAPDSLPVANRLAWLLATQPDAAVRAPAEAVAVAERAVRLPGGEHPDMLDTLAAAYAAAGRFADAAATADRAAALARGMGQQALADDIAARGALYRTERAFVVDEGGSADAPPPP